MVKPNPIKSPWSSLRQKMEYYFSVVFDCNFGPLRNKKNA
jgi:hypothetical protein